MLEKRTGICQTPQLWEQPSPKKGWISELLVIFQIRQCVNKGGANGTYGSSGGPVIVSVYTDSICRTKVFSEIMVERIHHIYVANGRNRCSYAAFLCKYLKIAMERGSGERGLPKRFLHGKNWNIRFLCIATGVGETDRDGLYFQPMVQCIQIRNSGTFWKIWFCKDILRKIQWNF